VSLFRSMARLHEILGPDALDESRNGLKSFCVDSQYAVSGPGKSWTAHIRDASDYFSVCFAKILLPSRYETFSVVSWMGRACGWHLREFSYG
jgi:hypothetical protein